MRRPLSTRALSLVLSLWLPLFMGGAEWAVRCPTHSGTSASASHATDGKAHVPGHDHDAEHSAPANHDAGDDGSNGAGHNCSCPGPSCCPPAVAVVPGVTAPMAHVVAVHEAIAISTLDLLPTDRDYLLPFATAPPAAALAPAASPVA